MHVKKKSTSRPLVTLLGKLAISLPDDDSQGADQAWNQADAYAIETFAKLECVTHAKNNNTQLKLGLINDTYGALYGILNAASQPFLECTISFTDGASTAYHYQHNGLDTSNIKTIDTLSEACLDIAIVKIPKQLDYLDLILAMLSQLRNDQNQTPIVILTGMQKYLSKNFYQLMEKYFGEIQVLPGVKKAKCIIATAPLKQPQYLLGNFIHTIIAEDFGLTLHNLPNVFSRQQLDIGTRFFLNNFPSLDGVESLLDIACGNGALSLYALQQSSQLTVECTDNSKLALLSLQKNINETQSKQVNLQHLNCLFNITTAPNSIDLILCNPPFHQGHNISDHIAHTMIKQAAQLLKQKGKFYLIGNSHLPYQAILKKYFKQVSRFANNDKFSIYEAAL